MKPLALAIVGDQTAFCPGAELSVQVAWQLESAPESLELRLIWFTQGKGDSDRSVVERWPLEFAPATGQQQFSLTLPPAPYSFSGKLISLVWALELVAEPSGLEEKIEITVAPEGQEVELYRPADL